MMQKTEKILTVACATGVLTNMLLLVQVARVEKENARLRVDNINLLRNTFIAVDALMNDRPVPIPVIDDLEFRRMAFMVEYEDVEDEEDS
jgi:hypothetical protein